MVADTFDIYADYDVSYEKGDFWINAQVDGAGNCVSDEINDDWFYDERSESELEEDEKVEADYKRSKRSSMDVSRAIWKNLKDKYPDDPLPELVAEWAEEVCLYEQQEAGFECPIPDELPDCDDFPVDPDTNDIVISLDEMIDSFDLTECQIETRQHMYQWADIMAQKKFLCEGCYDPICGLRGMMQDGKCSFDSMEHDDDDDQESVKDAVMALLVTARDSAQSNASVLVLVVAAALILAAKQCLDSMKMKGGTKGSKVNGANTGYGAVF